jgi:Acetyltransferase (GNAT) domain
MQPIIAPIKKELLLAELTKERFICPTNYLKNEIYIINGNDCPNLMREIGRLREVSFRAGGGGSLKECDTDAYDYGKYAYQQLIVWNPEDAQIVGGYRFVRCTQVQDEQGKFHLSTSEIVKYTSEIKERYFPTTIELGRSFIQPYYQPSAANRSNVFSLDNLWDGLGTLTVLYPQIEHFFGKITMYTNFNVEARDLLLAFMHHYFPDPDNLLILPNPLVPKFDCSAFIESIKGLPYKQGYIELNKRIRSLDENIPPLFNAYMNLSPTMRTFGTSLNTHFGSVEETGILITIADIYTAKKERHIQTYLNYLASK